MDARMQAASGGITTWHRPDASFAERKKYLIMLTIAV